MSCSISLAYHSSHLAAIEAWKTKLSLANELRDGGLESYQRDDQYKAFIEVILPVIIKILGTGEVNLMSGSLVHVGLNPLPYWAMS